MSKTHIDPTISAEWRKYTHMWARHEYREHSPGERVVADALELLGPQIGDSIIDFGCGTGRASDRMADRNLDTWSVDIAENAPGKRTMDRGQFVKACLWDAEAMRPVPVCSYGFCVDVMEHIPMVWVRSVLQHIKDHVEHGVFFQIATFHEKYGDLIGETLHLTVEPRRWWREQLEAYWPHVANGGEAKRPTFVCWNK